MLTHIQLVLHREFDRVILCLFTQLTSFHPVLILIRLWTRHWRLRDESGSRSCRRDRQGMKQFGNSVVSVGIYAHSTKVTPRRMEDLHLNQEIKEIITCVGIFGNPRIVGWFHKELREKSIPDKENKIYKGWEEVQQCVWYLSGFHNVCWIKEYDENGEMARGEVTKVWKVRCVS